MKAITRLFQIFVLFIFVGISISLTNCSDLNQTPDFINPDSFYQNSGDLVKGVNGVYDDLTAGYYNFFYTRFVFEELVGYQAGWEKGPLSFQNGDIATNDEYIDAYWNICYEAINRANGVIQAAQKMEEVGDQNLKNRVIAEAKFLRSWFYFNLIRYFDDVPFKTSRTTKLEFASNENGKRQVLDMMFEDLSSAAETLPAEYSGNNKGRVTKWAAKTLLMKAYLTDEQWNQARLVAEDIMNNSNLFLFDDFSRNFDVAYENSGERIFEGQVSASANSGESLNHNQHFIPPDLPIDQGGQGWHWLDGTKAFRMKYDPADKRIPGTFLESYPAQLGDTVVTVRWSPEANFNLSRKGGIVSSNADPNNPDELIYGGGFVAKWVEIGLESPSLNEKNVIYMRYADVLLGHSEAANESGQGDPYKGINLIRERAGLPLLSGLSQSEFRDAIVKEFVLEFAFEQKTYPFLKRVSSHGGDKKDYLGQYVDEFINTYGVDRTHLERDHVLPLPFEEVQSNKNVEQHPLWK